MLYICLWETIVFLILWRISKTNRKLRPGVLLALYLIATSTGRFAIEFLSLNHKRAFGLTEAQLVSIALATTGLVLLIVMRVRQDRLRLGTRRDLLAEHYGVIDHVENDGGRQAAASLEQQAVGSA
jgi:prolipoprotein diacylglyceryltransferase